nr:beta-lactamase family protein [Clostridia bacterium]
MPLGAALSSISLLLQNINVKKPTVHVLKNITPDKPVIFSDKNINYLDRTKPEEFGYTTEYIEPFLNEVTNDLSVRPNRVIIVKGDKVIGERYAHPYVKDAWNCVFSATKTVTALALGLLYDDGLVNLDEPVCNILDIANKVGNLQNKKITLRHLLTMSTGNTFNEVESAVSTKWVKDFFNSGNKFKIGSKFDYNSLNTYIIGACVEKLSGKHLSELVNERIFKPLGINDTYFEVSPEGIAKSGWGLFIIPEDMAKLGIMFRDYGVYKGQRILSEDWIKQMSSKQIASTKAGHRYDYGYQMWVKEEINLSFFNGMYNQDILMFRDSGVVVVMCCANNEAFHGSNHYPMVEKYFATKEMGNFELIKTPGSHDYPNNESLMHYYDSIVDKEFCPTNKKANACGILPLLLQNEMGTYAKGIKKLMFTKKDENYSLNITEGT